MPRTRGGKCYVPDTVAAALVARKRQPKFKYTEDVMTTAIEEYKKKKTEGQKVPFRDIAKMYG